MHNTSGRIRECEGSSFAAKLEVLVSPARPPTIIAANESLPSQCAGFLVMHRECIALIVRHPSQAARGSACPGPPDATYERCEHTHAHLGGDIDEWRKAQLIIIIEFTKAYFPELKDNKDSKAQLLMIHEVYARILLQAQAKTLN